MIVVATGAIDVNFMKKTNKSFEACCLAASVYICFVIFISHSV